MGGTVRTASTRGTGALGASALGGSGSGFGGGGGAGRIYYVMDLLEHSDIDFDNLDRGVVLQVNGTNCSFMQELKPQDDVVIRYLET